VGIWMLRGAPWLMRLAFEEPLEPPPGTAPKG
jgi:hypothetical protein